MYYDLHEKVLTTNISNLEETKLLEMQNIVKKFESIYVRDDGITIYLYPQSLRWKDTTEERVLSLGDEVPLVKGVGNLIVERAGIVIRDIVERDRIICTYLVPVPAWSLVIFDPQCTLAPDEEHQTQEYRVETNRKSVKILEDRKWRDLYGKKIRDSRRPVVSFL